MNTYLQDESSNVDADFEDDGADAWSDDELEPARSYEEDAGSWGEGDDEVDAEEWIPSGAELSSDEQIAEVCPAPDTLNPLP